MKNTRTLSNLLLLLLSASCIPFEEKPSKQQYPDYKLSSMEEIVITDYKTDSVNKITDQNRLENFQQFFYDSTNYFYSDSITFNGQKSTHRLDLVREIDTLTLFLYLTPEPKKLEIGYFDPEELKIHNQFNEYKRFYIHSDILNLLKAPSQ